MKVANTFSLLVTFNCSALTTPSTVRLSATFTFLNEPLKEPLKSPSMFWFPLTYRVVSSNVSLDESCNSPPPPASTILLSVKSVTVKDAILASSVIIKSENEADFEPLRLCVICCSPVTLRTEPSNVKFADESTPCVAVNVVIWLFTPLPLIIESPLFNNRVCSEPLCPAIHLSVVPFQRIEPDNTFGAVTSLA